MDLNLLTSELGDFWEHAHPDRREQPVRAELNGSSVGLDIVGIAERDGYLVLLLDGPGDPLEARRALVARNAGLGEAHGGTGPQKGAQGRG